MNREALIEKMAQAVCISQDAVCPDPNHDPCHTTTLVHVGEAVEAALTAITEAGMVVVPREPTDEMCMDAAKLFVPRDATAEDAYRAFWQAMLAAAEKGE